MLFGCKSTLNIRHMQKIFVKKDQYTAFCIINNINTPSFITRNAAISRVSCLFSTLNSRLLALGSKPSFTSLLLHSVSAMLHIAGHHLQY